VNRDSLAYGASHLPLERRGAPNGDLLALVQARIDLGPCRAIRHEGDPGRCAVLLPGQFYPTRAPALWFAREAAISRGWSALEVLGEPGEHDDPLGWERECARLAIEATSAERPLVIGKSLATLLAGEIAGRGLPAVWLTPLLDQPSVIDGLAKTKRPTLLAGGDADPTWLTDRVPDNRAIEVLELPGVDHAVQVPGDPRASVDALARLVDGITRFVQKL
jgi:pimeloyl-ACP methyl ester carboxylesterase